MADPLPWDQFETPPQLSADQPDRVVIIGAGLAGCWMARTLAERGISVEVLDSAATAASGASSNPAGIVKPFVTRSPSLAMRFYEQAHRYCLEQLDNWDLIDRCEYSGCGVVQLVDRPYSQSPQFVNLNKQQMQARLHHANAGHGLLFAEAGWLNPQSLCSALLEHELIELQTGNTVQTLKQSDDKRWLVRTSNNSNWRTAHVVIANGAALSDLGICRHLSVIPARGQISRFRLGTVRHAPQQVISGKHYVIPAKDSVYVGATFERDSLDSSVRHEDNHLNMAGLRRMLPELPVEAEAAEAFAGIRATTPDRLPLVGPLSDASACALAYEDLRHGRKWSEYPPLPLHSGICVLGGLGSRGIVTAPYAAWLLADYMSGGTHISEWAPLINPARFQIRQLKRGAPEAV